METEAIVTEYRIKIDAEDMRALYEIVSTIEKLSIETEWAINFMIAYDRIREQIEKDVID